jgi:hypothetical protein
MLPEQQAHLAPVTERVRRKDRHVRSRQSSVPTIVPESYQNSGSRANASQLAQSEKSREVTELRGRWEMIDRWNSRLGKPLPRRPDEE